MPELKDLKPYDVDAARKRLAALDLEITAGRGGGIAKALARQLRREIAVAERGEHPSIAARPSQVPAVKGSRIGRSADEPLEATEPVAPQGEQAPAGGAPVVSGRTPADIEAEIEARVQERLRQERAAQRVAGKVKKAGKGKKGKGRAKPKPASPDAAQTV